jgi:hypothetical protein
MDKHWGRRAVEWPLTLPPPPKQKKYFKKLIPPFRLRNDGGGGQGQRTTTAEKMRSRLFFCLHKQLNNYCRFYRSCITGCSKFASFMR